MIVVSDFRMTKTPPNFRWFGETRADLPLLRWVNGTIFRPFLFYFCYIDRFYKHRISRKSMVKQAYALREFLTYITSRKRSWNEVNDLVFHEWREAQRNGGASPDQIERKIHWVYEFYRRIHQAMPYDDRANAVPQFVALPNDPPGSAPITSKLIKHEGREIFSWAGANPRKKSIPDWGVPSQSQVQHLLSSIRYPKSVAETDKDEVSTIRKHERDYLMASTMAFGGFRAIEVSRLAVSDLTRALTKEGILDGIAKRFGPFKCVSALADNEEAQKQILANLKAFVQKRKRKYVFVHIIGKGNKPRNAPFSA